MEEDEDIAQFADEEEGVLDDSVFDEDQELFEDEAFGEEEFLEEEWEDSGGSEQEEIAEGGKKKKSKLLFIGVGAAVAVIAVIFMMGSGQKQPANKMAGAGKQVAQQKAGPSPTQMDIIMGNTLEGEKEKAQSQEKSAASQGLMNDPEALKKIEKIREDLIFEEHIIDQSDDNEEWPGEPRVVYQENPPMPSPMQTNVLTPMPEAGGQVDTISSYSPDPVVTTEDSVDEPEADMQDILMPRAQDVQKSTGGSSAADPSLTVKLDKIAARLDAMDGRLARIEKEAVKSKEFAALKNDVEKLRNTSSAAMPAQSGKTVSGPQRVAAKAASSSTQAAKMPVSKMTAEAWVLKAAQPGSAYVSRKGQQEVIALKVGDNLPGIGKVQEIKMENSVWVVIGSQGRILQ